MNSAGSAGTRKGSQDSLPEEAPESEGLTGVVTQADATQVIQEGLRVGNPVGQVGDLGDGVDRAVKDCDSGVQQPRRVGLERDLQHLFSVSVAVVCPAWHGKMSAAPPLRTEIRQANSREELFQVCERLHVARGIVRVGLRSNKLVVPALDELKVGLGSALADDGQDDVFVPADCVAVR